MSWQRCTQVQRSSSMISFQLVGPGTSSILAAWFPPLLAPIPVSTNKPTQHGCKQTNQHAAWLGIAAGRLSICRHASDHKSPVQLVMLLHRSNLQLAGSPCFWSQPLSIMTLPSLLISALAYCVTASILLAVLFRKGGGGGGGVPSWPMSPSCQHPNQHPQQLQMLSSAGV